jgi:hypothetical protein
VPQQVFSTLGRLDELKASGRFEILMRSGLRHCERFAVIDAQVAGETQAVTVLRIGPELVFGRLWQEAVFRKSLNRCWKLAATSLTVSFTPSTSVRGGGNIVGKIA